MREKYKTNISAIILAGGKSSRMKYSKEFIKIGDEFLVHNQIKELQPLFDEIIIVSDNKDHYKNFDVKVVCDVLKGKSPIIGLHSGLLNSTNEYNYCIACDMPYINIEFIKFLINKINNHDSYVSKYHGYIEPFNAIYSKNLVPVIEELVFKNEFGFQNMVKRIKTYYIEENELLSFLNKTDLFKNINNESELFNSNENNTIEYRKYKIKKVINQNSFFVDDKVITEYPLNIILNNKHYITMMTSPTNLEFLVIGHLFNDGIITNITEIKSIKIDLEEHKCEIAINNNLLPNTLERAKILSTACGGSKKIDMDLLSKLKIDNNSTFNLENILDEVAGFNKESVLFKETGGVHSVKLIFDNNELIIEDIGRHNAVDKIVGYMMKNRISTSNRYIITSGRVSSDILLKCATSNIPLIVSRSAPTTLSINLAKHLGITILGFARGNKVNIYTNSERIIL